MKVQRPRVVRQVALDWTVWSLCLSALKRVWGAKADLSAIADEVGEGVFKAGSSTVSTSHPFTHAHTCSVVVTIRTHTYLVLVVFPRIRSRTTPTKQKKITRTHTRYTPPSLDTVVVAVLQAGRVTTACVHLTTVSYEPRGVYVKKHLTLIASCYTRARSESTNEWSGRPSSIVCTGYTM